MKDTRQTNRSQKSDLKDNVLSRIDRESLRPRSKLVCKITEYSVWSLWLITVVLGGAAVAETFYASMHAGVEFYELTHGDLWQFILANLPYFWIAAFVAFLALAYVNVRHTKCGYRYRLWQVVLSNVLLTLFLGVFLNFLGMGKMIDHLMNQMPMPYESVEERQAYLWAHPEDGRITGRYRGFTDQVGNILFLDRVEREWVIITDELSGEDQTLLLSGESVRLLGEAIENSPRRNVFYACAVHPWMHENDIPIRSIQENRQRLKNTIAEFKTRSTSGESVMICTRILSEIMPEKPSP